jgi:hypothetical protein
MAPITGSAGRLWKSPLVKAKCKAAIQVAKKLGLKYLLVTVEPVPFLQLKDLYDSGRIRFTDKYQTLYKEYVDSAQILTGSR